MQNNKIVVKGVFRKSKRAPNFGIRESVHSLCRDATNSHIARDGNTNGSLEKSAKY